MGVQFATKVGGKSKQDTKSKQSAAKPKSDIAVKVDRYAAIQGKLDALDPEVKEQSGIAKDLRDKAGTQPASKPVVFEGSTHNVIFSDANDKSEVTDAGLARKFLGDELFFKIAMPSITELKKYLTQEQFEQCVKVTPNGGSRRISLVPRK